MPDEQKQNEISPEEMVKHRKTDYLKRRKREAYWTFEVGVKLLLPKEYKGTFPIKCVIDESSLLSSN